MPAYLGGSLDEADRERAADPGVACPAQQPDALRHVRVIFQSVPELIAAIEAYLKANNQTPNCSSGSRPSTPSRPGGPSRLAVRAATGLDRRHDDELRDPVQPDEHPPVPHAEPPLAWSTTQAADVTLGEPSDRGCDALAIGP
jgi:hypothetical protein